MSPAMYYPGKNMLGGESDRNKGRQSREIRLIGCSGDGEPLRKGLLIAYRDFNLWYGSIKRRGGRLLGGRVDRGGNTK